MFPESAARVLAEMTHFSWWLKRPRTGIKKYKVDKPAAENIIKQAKKEGRTFLLEQEAYEILKAYGFPVIKSKLTDNIKAAQEASEDIGYPVVMKIASPDVIHKFDFGGVSLNIRTPAEVKKAYNTIRKNVLEKNPKARIKGILVEEMAKEGKEIILGVNHDPQFGPILMFGLGGIYVEALEDVSFRLAPVNELTASRMITTTKTYKILDGYRGGPVYDLKAVEDCIKRLSQLAVDFDEIKELDINPLIVYEKGKGCTIVDARIILRD